jgi:putative sugar O-methyltransferase
MNKQPYRNEEAFSYLSNLINSPEAGRSAHWAWMLANYAYKEGEFQGLDGFGGHQPRSVLGSAAHYIMQTPYRLMAKTYPRFTEIHRIGRSIAACQNRLFDLDMLRQVLTMAFIDDLIDLEGLPGIPLVIGDGFGALTALLLSLLPGRQIMLINLTPVLLVDLTYIRKVFPLVEIALVESQAQMEAALDQSKETVIALRADFQNFIRHAPISLAVNVSSMHEMQPSIVERYFSNLRSAKGEHTYFYCCNRIRKELPDGTVTEFMKYPWHVKDDIIVDELCPWHQKYYIFPPRYLKYDGPIQHRLARLLKTQRDNTCENGSCKSLESRNKRECF